MQENPQERTGISEINDNFLSKISDYSLLKVPKEELVDEFFGYFNSARTKFYRCKNNLETEKNDVGEIFLKSKLHPFEIEIIVTLMLVEYMKPIVLSSEALKQLLSDKDFKVHSQANQLHQLSLLHRNLKSEANKMITEYTYFDLEEEKM